MPGPLRSFLSKKSTLGSKRDGYDHYRFDRHMLTTHCEGMSSKSPAQRSTTRSFVNNFTGIPTNSYNSQTSLLRSRKVQKLNMTVGFS